MKDMHDLIDYLEDVADVNAWAGDEDIEEQDAWQAALMLRNQANRIKDLEHELAQAQTLIRHQFQEIGKLHASNQKLREQQQ